MSAVVAAAVVTAPVVMAIAAVVATPAVHHDAAVVLTRMGAGRIVVGEDRRRGAGEESRGDGGDQETVHSLFLRLVVTRTFGRTPAIVKVTVRGRDCNKTLAPDSR